MAYFCIDEEKDFTRRRCSHSSGTLTRLEVLDFLKNSQEESFQYKDKKYLKIMLTPKLLLCTGSIRENQVYHTVTPEGYHHIFWELFPHYEVYFRIDHSQKIISFRLGTYHRTLEIREQTRWTYKLQGERVLCQTAEQMEEALLSSGSKRYGVDLGRKALQIKEFV